MAEGRPPAPPTASTPFKVPVEGGVLAGEARGRAPRLVLLHGIGGSRATWDGVVAALPANLPFIRYDLRGFGASAQEEGAEFSHPEDLLRLLDARRIERAALCGLSMGGAVATTFAIDYPERVSRLILISPAMTAWEWSDEWRALWKAIATAARSGNIAAARELWFDHPLFASTRESTARDDLRRSIMAWSGQQWIKDWQRPALPDVDRLHRITAPTLLLTGERDLPDFRLIADVLAGAVPDIRRIDHPGAGHMLPLERPAETAAAIAGFLD